jgi:hypothetical protein
MKKKIGLLTLPLMDNYGGIIQLTALNNYLRSEGYEVYHLNKRYDITILKQFVRRFFKWNPFYAVYDLNNHAKKHRYIKNLNDFISAELTNTTKNIYSSSQLSKKVKDLELDAVIVGSDQVWRMSYIKDNYKDYFLGFVSSKTVKKIAYAASFGTDVWEDQNNIAPVTSLLTDFTAISIREDSGVALCENTFLINAEHVLDPTFLPKSSYYEEIISREFNCSKNIGLFNYVLDKSPKKNEIITNVAKKLKLDINSIYLENNLKDFSKKRKLKPSMGEWLYHFKNAKFIITDSFHGTVFSIIFNKQFIAIGNKSRGITRFTSLLKSLGLSSRLILDDSEHYLSTVNQTINYDLVNSKLEHSKLDSIAFLKNALS